MIPLNETYEGELRKAAKIIREESFFRVFSHYDADGVASAVVISEMLRRQDKDFHLSFLRAMDNEIIKESSGYPIIISDLGSDVPELSGGKGIIVDHHIFSGQGNSSLVNLNPRKFGYDGTKEACSSTIAFLLSLEVDQSNEDLFPAFIGGVIGDKQNVGGFHGINSGIVSALKQKYPATKDISLVGRSISEAIYLSIDPYFIGLSGDEEAARFFVESLGINPDVSPLNLRTDEKEKIVENLTIRLISQGVSREGYETLVTDIFNFPAMGTSSNLIYEYMDASGRNGRMGLPVSWFLGNDEAVDDMHSIFIKFRGDALAQVKRSSGMIKDLGNVIVTHVDNPFLAGITASTLAIYVNEVKKPVVAIYNNKECKISGRATRDQIASGVDLSLAIGQAAQEVGGHGGGHDIAAGAEIPFGKEEEFILKVNGMIGEQIANSKGSSKI
ncbi:MAG: DHH family phosphoesterase [Thermoplasmatales archaeon]